MNTRVVCSVVVKCLLFTSLLLSSITPALSDRGWKIDENPKDKRVREGKRFLQEIDNNTLIWEWFEDFVVYYNKSYADSTEEYKAFTLFEATVKRVNEINNDYTLDWWASPNFFSDMDKETLAAKYLTTLPSIVDNTTSLNNTRRMMTSVSAPNYIDWNAYGKMPVAKSQSCGSCWAVAAQGTLEAAYLISQGLTLSQVPTFTTSEQAIIDCSGAGTCNGGGSDGVISYAYKNGVTLQGSYYGPQYCYNPYLDDVVRLRYDVQRVAQYSEYALMQAVSIVPTIVYFAVGDDDFWTYRGGIWSPKRCATVVNHALVVYGYQWTGNSATSYWMAQNSWGPTWGDNGRINVAFTGDGTEGACKMYTFGVYAYPDYSKTSPRFRGTTVFTQPDGDSLFPNPPSPQPSPPPSPSPSPSPPQQSSPQSEDTYTFVYTANFQIEDTLIEPLVKQDKKAFAFYPQTELFNIAIQLCEYFTINDSDPIYLTQFIKSYWFTKDVIVYKSNITVTSFQKVTIKLYRTHL